MIYNVKRFSQDRERDTLPTRFIDLPEFREIKEKVWKVEYSPKVNKQISKHPEFTRKRIKSLKKSLEEGNVYEDSIKLKDENTHYLSRFSSPKKYHRLTKNINDHDRFDYIVYPPNIFLDPETGEKILVSKIVVQSVCGHFDWEKENPYSEIK